MPIIYGTVAAPSNTSAADSSNQPLLQGKAGEGVVAELHGKWYTAAYRNRVFYGSTAQAGITIPVTSTTTATFFLYNPLGSGVNAELVSMDIGLTTTTFVVGAVGLNILTGLGATTAVPTLTTPITATVGSTLLGGSGVNQCKLYSSATGITASTNLFTLFTFTATSGAAPVYHYEFDGRLVLAPGSAVFLASTAAQTQPTTVSTVWAEWPL